MRISHSNEVSTRSQNVKLFSGQEAVESITVHNYDFHLMFSYSI